MMVSKDKTESTEAGKTHHIKPSRIEREKHTVSLMIKIYCRGKHREKNNCGMLSSYKLCPICTELEAYAHRRLDMCKYGNNKTFCKQCPTHCYKPQMRTRIREVMRYSGPRMILYAPLEALRHLVGK